MPEKVRQALALAEEMHFAHSCTPETGNLLMVLAGSCRHSSIAEIGTGCGVGATWLLSALPANSRLVSVDLDAARIAAAKSLFDGNTQVNLLAGDWHQLAGFGPFDMIFVDVGEAKTSGAEDVLAMLSIGGMVILDDLTPQEMWPPEWAGKPDIVRDFWLNDPRLAAIEIRTTPSSAVILATRRR